jgi:predicted HTH domain antitoxin
MIFSVEVPDSFTKSLHLDGPKPNHRALEVLALEGYRAGELSRGQVSELLDMGFDDTERFLKAHHANIELSLEEFREDAAAIERLLAS